MVSYMFNRTRFALLTAYGNCILEVDVILAQPSQKSLRDSSNFLTFLLIGWLAGSQSEAMLVNDHPQAAILTEQYLVTQFWALELYDNVIKCKYFSRYWRFVREIHRSPVNFPHKGQWRGASMFSLICAWINSWVNNGEAGDSRRHCIHYDVIVINNGYCILQLPWTPSFRVPPIPRRDIRFPQTLVSLWTQISPLVLWYRKGLLGTSGGQQKLKMSSLYQQWKWRHREFTVVIFLSQSDKRAYGLMCFVLVRLCDRLCWYM